MMVEATSLDARDHLVRRLVDATIKTDPYEHTYVTGVWPDWYYSMMRAELPPDEAYTDRTFENRAMAKVETLGPFWQDMLSWMTGREVLGTVLDMFQTTRKTERMMVDLRLVRDRDGYKIAPHTDIRAKSISLLFYLAEEPMEVGTEVYVPKEKGFESDGGRRYEFEDFETVYTAPFVPNSMFGFPRSNISFHGVKPIKVVQRDVLLLNLYAT